MSTYKDCWIECAEDGLRIRGYYFPWGTKHIDYGSIRSVQRTELGLMRGKARIWGSGNPRHWLHLDPRRPRKETGLVLGLGRAIEPIITPDDPDTVERILRERAGLPEQPDAGRPNPFV